MVKGEDTFSRNYATSSELTSPLVAFPTLLKVVSIFKVIPRESGLSFEEKELRDVERSKNAGIINEHRSTFNVSLTSIKYHGYNHEATS